MIIPVWSSRTEAVQVVVVYDEEMMKMMMMMMGVLCLPVHGAVKATQVSRLKHTMPQQSITV